MRSVASRIVASRIVASRVVASRVVAVAAGVIALGGVPSRARATQAVDDPAIVQERDALIDKIARGDDVDASVKRFAALVKERDRVVATSRAAKEAEEKARLAEQSARKDYEKTADHD